jgi:hypothetical protein
MSGQSFTERAKARTIQRAEAVMANSGYPERVLVGARVQSGPSQWWSLLSAYATFFRKYYFIGVTERNVVLCGISRWTGRPKSVKFITPRDQVQLTDYIQSGVWDSFRYMTPQRNKPLKLRFSRAYRREVEAIFGAVNSGAMPAVGPGLGQGLGQGQGYPPQYPR